MYIMMAAPSLGKLALAMHPDKPGGSKTAFQETLRFSDEVSGQLQSICSFRYCFMCTKMKLKMLLYIEKREKGTKQKHKSHLFLQSESH